MTTSEAMAACLARGLREPECAALIADRTVNGAYCDGTIVQSASGSRCVPQATLDAAAAARAAHPLIRASAPGSGSSPPLLVGAAVLGGVVVLALILSRG